MTAYMMAMKFGQQSTLLNAFEATGYHPSYGGLYRWWFASADQASGEIGGRFLCMLDGHYGFWRSEGRP